MEYPYDDIEWGSVDRLHSVNHMHTFSANPGEDDWEIVTDHQDGLETFRSMYESGIRHFPLSNYHPSKPTYPLEAYFDDVPADALGCPNAETGLADDRGHFCSLGSTFETIGGYEGTWQELFDRILAELYYEDGGGIVMNHPVRTGVAVDTLIERFEYDDRVLGIEAWNHRCEEKYGGTGDALSVWDELLLTGRQVFGFFNPDYHTPWYPVPDWADETWGRNVLLVPEATEEAAARAYRQGHFFGAFQGSGLAFERIDATPDEITVETNGASRIDFVSDRSVVRTDHAATATYEVNGKETYVRVEARDDDGERIFSQPIQYRHPVDGTERHT